MTTQRRLASRLPLRLIFALCVLPFAMGADDTGCQSQSSSDVNQDRIYATYWTYYDANTDVTYARAQFRFGSAVGTTLILDGAAEVSFEGQPMPFDPLLDWHATQLAGKVERGTFEYRNADGEVFLNTAPAFTPIDFASPPAALDRGQAATLSWTGTALADDEIVETIVANNANRFDFERIDAGGRGTRSVVIPGSTLDRIAPGAALISFRRHRDYPLSDDAGGGGKLTTTTQPRDHFFTLR